MTSNNLVLTECSPDDLFKMKSGLEFLNLVCQDVMSNENTFPRRSRINIPFMDSMTLLMHDDVIYFVKSEEGSFDSIVVRIDAVCDYYNDSEWRVKYEPIRSLYTVRHKSHTGVIITSGGKDHRIDNVPVLVSEIEDCSSEVFQQALVHNTAELNAMVIHELFKDVLIENNTHLQIGETFFPELIKIYDNREELKELLYANC